MSSLEDINKSDSTKEESKKSKRPILDAISRVLGDRRFLKQLAEVREEYELIPADRVVDKRRAAEEILRRRNQQYKKDRAYIN